MAGTTRYAASGVDEPREQRALATMLRAFARTLGARTGVGSVLAETDHFGSLIRLPAGLGLAIATDGVGTKLMIAQQLKRYREIAQDLVANNVNDILCMGATPIALVDYIGLDVADEEFLTQFSAGLADAACEAGIAVVGGEIAQIGEMLESRHPSPRFDVVATAVGLCSLAADAKDADWPRALDRADVKPGNLLIGIRSSGLHSNGFSLARRVLLAEAGLRFDAAPPELAGATVGDALLVPTRIYVKPLVPLLMKGLVSGIANISGGGLLTVSRLNPKAGFEIATLPEPHPIFELIRARGKLEPAEMLSTFNMGLGMVLAVPPANVDAAMAMLTQAGEHPLLLGRVVAPTVPGEVVIPSLRIRGVGHEFEPISAVA
jgi:phosphoribosylformylglycinamidine cyclo-ligase